MPALDEIRNGQANYLVPDVRQTSRRLVDWADERGGTENLLFVIAAWTILRHFELAPAPRDQAAVGEYLL